MTRVLFNMAAAALSMWLAASLFFWLVTPPAPIGRIVLPLALFGAAYFFSTPDSWRSPSPSAAGLQVHRSGETTSFRSG